MNARAHDGFLGVGIYSVPEAARLTGMAAYTIRRWLTGYTARGTAHEPLWTSQINWEDGLYLGFADVVELHAARTFLQEGVSANTIRKAIAAARRWIDVERPLSSQRLRTDGRTVFLQIAKETGDDTLIELTRGQLVFKSIVDRSLRDVDFVGGEPTLWRHGSRRSGVVLDPARSFGQPIEVETSVPTRVLAAAAKAEGDVRQAARLWDVPVRAIARAIAFEERLATA